MRTVPLNVYKFSELSSSAKERAKHDYECVFGFAWADEAMDSITALTKHFGGQITDWEIDWFNGSYSSMSFDMPEMDKDEINERLKQLGTYNPETLKGRGDCKLTGYCMDEDAIDGFRKAFNGGEWNLNLLMEAAFNSWLEAGQAECEASYEDEQFSDHCDINNYEFTADGNLYSK